MQGQNDGAFIKKGPWTAEEDEVVMNFVKKYGPRDWSSIRSQGLLPRTGKSCRLRWVNKLRPNLKTGCKFSAEEERIVIDLQAQFGNKWARIATYLPGRTDNDVKNLWSTRQKRLARIMQTPSPPTSQRNKGKIKVSHEMAMREVPTTNFIPMEEESSSSRKDQSCLPSCLGNSEMFKMVPLQDLVKPNWLNLETNLPTLEASPIHMMPSNESLPNCVFSQLPQPQLNLPFLPESQELIPGPGDPDFLDLFDHLEASEIESNPKVAIGSVAPKLEGSAQNGRAGDNDAMIPDSFFDNFPPDMFDCLEPLPSSSEW
ncbi:hypothetical protein L1049_020773 [Liquidambar formosana]|uniref:Uncharacterized protein n=1 Tax=Liquidambar formosana TaxID=63359 RepID=A0AAP0XA52_LIQFO